MTIENYTYVPAQQWQQMGTNFAQSHPWVSPMTPILQQDYQALVPLIIARMQHSQAAQEDWQKILGQPQNNVKPFIIGITGSVAVGKSTVAKTLKSLLTDALADAKVEIVTTDSFLYNNAFLAANNLMDRKGFPESYDTTAMLTFLQAVKERQGNIAIPIYSHELYDIVVTGQQVLEQPDIIILEGVNALYRQGQALAPLDLMDLTLYVDAEVALIEEWFLMRFEHLVEQAKTQPTSYYQQFIANRPAATQLAIDVWHQVNEVNLMKYILPTRQLADIVIKKGPNHIVTQVALRKY